MKTSDTLNQWSFPGKIAFRFLFAYFALYTFPFPTSYIPLIGDWLSEWTSHFWDPFVLGFGKQFFGLEISVRPTGSGDKTYDFVQLLVFVSLASAATIIWTALDRKRQNYNKLYSGLEVFIRYYLGAILISYGLAKIFKTQFPMPGPYSLTQELGTISPMKLAWTFMGFSEGFNLFTGIGEALGGFLLFFRRTKVLGGFLSLAVMSNIVAMNFFYDIPVKLFSAHLLLMILFVLASDFKRITNFLILNKPVAPKAVLNAFTGTRYYKPALIFKLLFIGYFLYSETSSSLESIKLYGDRAPKPPLYGIYEVEEFRLNDSILPGAVTDTLSWNKMLVQWDETCAIEMMNAKKRYLGMKTDTTEQTVHIYNWRDSLNDNGTFSYQYQGEDSLYFSGVWQSDTIDVLFKYRDPEDYPLLSRGFHWINERPYNR